MDDFPFPQKLDHIPHIRIVGEAEDVVVGETGFLFRRQIFGEVGDGVPGNGQGFGGEGGARGSLGIDTGGVVHKVGVKAAVLDLFGG